MTVDEFERAGMVAGTVEPDARTTLDRLAEAGFRLAVLTNNSLRSADAALARFDLRASFELVLARGVVSALKPDGAGVRQAHVTLGGGPTVVVGDAAIDGQAAGPGGRRGAVSSRSAPTSRCWPSAAWCRGRRSRRWESWWRCWGSKGLGV